MFLELLEGQFVVWLPENKAKSDSFTDSGPFLNVGRPICYSKYNVGFIISKLACELIVQQFRAFFKDVALIQLFWSLQPTKFLPMSLTLSLNSKTNSKYFKYRLLTLTLTLSSSKLSRRKEVFRRPLTPSHPAAQVTLKTR